MLRMFRRKARSASPSIEITRPGGALLRQEAVTSGEDEEDDETAHPSVGHRKQKAPKVKKKLAAYSLLVPNIPASATSTSISSNSSSRARSSSFDTSASAAVRLELPACSGRSKSFDSPSLALSAPDLRPFNSTSTKLMCNRCVHCALLEMRAAITRAASGSRETVTTATGSDGYSASGSESPSTSGGGAGAGAVRDLATKSSDSDTCDDDEEESADEDGDARGAAEEGEGRDGKGQDTGRGQETEDHEWLAVPAAGTKTRSSSLDASVCTSRATQQLLAAAVCHLQVPINGVRSAASAASSSSR